MTIAQQFLGKKTCKQQEEPLVPSEKTPSIKDAEEGRPVVVTMHAHVRRVSSLTTLCVFVTALFVLTTGIFGGVYLYRQFTHYKAGQSANLRHYRGWCSIPYLPDIEEEPAKHEPMVASQEHALIVAATQAWEPSSLKTHYFEEELDIDIKFGQYERIEVPAFSHGRKGHFIHDFVVNKSGLADYENHRCFLMILNRSYVYPPRVLYEQVTRMRSGYYDADTQIVRHTMQVMTPPISDLKNIGFFISRDCASMPIYMLEPVTSPVFKRSLNDDSKNLFVEFAGNKVNEYKIVNINDATPGEST